MDISAMIALNPEILMVGDVEVEDRGVNVEDVEIEDMLVVEELLI